MMRCSLAKLWLSIGLAGLILTGCNTAMATSDTFEFRLEFETKDGPVKIVRPIHCETVWRGTGGKGYRMTPKFVRHRHKNGFFEVRLKHLCAQFDNPDSIDSFLGDREKKNVSVPDERRTTNLLIESLAWFEDSFNLDDAEIHDFAANLIDDERNYIRIASRKEDFNKLNGKTLAIEPLIANVKLPKSPIKKMGLPESFVQKVPEYLWRRKKLAVIRVPEASVSLLNQLDCSLGNICIPPAAPQRPTRNADNTEVFGKLWRKWSSDSKKIGLSRATLLNNLVGKEVIEEVLNGPNSHNPYFQDLAFAFGLRSSVQGPMQGIEALALPSSYVQLHSVKRISLFEDAVVKSIGSSAISQSLYTPGFLQDFADHWTQFKDEPVPMHRYETQSYLNIEGHKIGNSPGAIPAPFVYVPASQLVYVTLGGGLRYAYPMREN